MATIQETLDRLPSRPQPEAKRARARSASRGGKVGPEIVVNDVDVTMVFTAPFAFALPKRLVDFLLRRFKTGEVTVSVSSAQREVAGTPRPAAKRAPKRAPAKRAATRPPRKPVRRAA